VVEKNVVLKESAVLMGRQNSENILNAADVGLFQWHLLKMSPTRFSCRP